MEDTICAISSATGIGAISIIRISGSKAIEVSEKIFNKSISKALTHTIHYGHIVDKGEKIDEVLVMVMKAPKTYTKEDIVEINCHGNIIACHQILNLLLKNGCRMAEPGEFTKRAFLNGRIDLVEAEAVADLLMAKSEKAKKMALNQMCGILSNEIKKIREELTKMLTNIEVNIDYPEYEDIEKITIDQIQQKVNNIFKSLEKIIERSKTGKIIKEGLKIVIVGKPNVGKSSILNTLSQSESAIVTNIPGTTRDTIEIEIVLNGVKINLIDTAGIRKTNNQIEKIGVEKSRQAIKQADLVLLVLDNSTKLSKEETSLFEYIKNYPHLIFINKSDLESNIDLKMFKSEEVVFGNTKNLEGLDILKSKIISMFNLGLIENNDATYFSNVRQISLLEEAQISLENVLKAIQSEMAIEFISLDLRMAWEKLGEIVGENYKEELLDELFKRFCVGK